MPFGEAEVLPMIGCDNTSTATSRDSILLRGGTVGLWWTNERLEFGVFLGDLGN